MRTVDSGLSPGISPSQCTTQLQKEHITNALHPSLKITPNEKRSPYQILGTAGQSRDHVSASSGDIIMPRDIPTPSEPGMKTNAGRYPERTSVRKRITGTENKYVVSETRGEDLIPEQTTPVRVPPAEECSSSALRTTPPPHCTGTHGKQSHTASARWRTASLAGCPGP